MPDATFTTSDLTTFTGLDDLGLIVTGQRLEPDRAVLDCRVLDPDDWCHHCGCQGRPIGTVVRRPIGTVVRRLAHAPFGWRPTTLHVRVRRYRCTGCGQVWHQDTTAAAEPRAKLPRGGLHWALVAIVCQHLTVARVAEALAVSWNCTNDAVPAEGRRVLIADPARLEEVSAIGVDEHVWRHTRFGDKYVTVIIDLTPIRCGTDPAKLLDMVEGRCAQVLAAWLAAQAQDWRDGVDVVAMDGFTGFKNAAAAELPEAVTVMDPFHVVRLAGQAVDDVRRRRQQELHSRRGRTRDPLYRARRVVHTGADLLTDRHKSRLRTLFSHGARGDDHVEVEATWAVYQRMLAAYRHPDRAAGRTAMSELIGSLSGKIPAALCKVRRLGRTLNQRAADVLAYFDRPGTSNGPTEAINGRLEHLRGSALGFRNLTNYIARSLLEAGGFRPLLHPRS